MNGGRPGRQARSRAQGSIGVPPVFPIRVQDDDQKLAERTSPRSHSPICSRHSETQARRLCYLGLGVMPPLRPVGESSLLKMSKLQGPRSCAIRRGTAKNIDNDHLRSLLTLSRLLAMPRRIAQERVPARSEDRQQSA